MINISVYRDFKNFMYMQLVNTTPRFVTYFLHFSFYNKSLKLDFHCDYKKTPFYTYLNIAIVRKHS